MKTIPAEKVFRVTMTSAERAKADAKARKMIQRVMLSELRKSLGVTQKELARAMGVSQPVLSKVEHQADLQLTTLRRIIHALGGEIDIIARFPNRTVALRVA
jgi:DNA-binding transcriptional regulator YiaG